MHRYVYSCTDTFTLAQIRLPVHRYVYTCTDAFKLAQIRLHLFTLGAAYIKETHKTIAIESGFGGGIVSSGKLYIWSTALPGL